VDQGGEHGFEPTTHAGGGSIRTRARTGGYPRGANGKTFVVESHGNSRDHKIVDNGDGTLTIWFKDAFKSTVWIDGEFLFHDFGSGSGAVLIDHNGTPTFPDDDVFLGFVEDPVNHGRLDTIDRDFCEDLAIYLGD
jgi:hypothetical protein